jgi:fructuronate reductase
MMKLRLLNGSHSAIAYLGGLAGHETVADAMADPAFAIFVRQMMDDEITPTLPALPGFDVDAYKASLMARFANMALRHRTAQIAMDGSQKLPQRLLETIRDRLAAGQSISLLALAVAGWMRHAAGVDEQGRVVSLKDPMAPALALATGCGLDPHRLATALMGIEGIFGTDLPHDPRFAGPVTQALDLLIKKGAARAVAEVNGLLP